MRKSEKLKICNWFLLIFGLLILASGIQLEATRSSGIFTVLIHVVIASIFTILVITHIYLHFKWNNWLAKFQKLNKPVTRILWYLFLLTDILGIIAFIHWLISYHHSPLGGIHGKMGFIMLALAIGHTIKRKKFFKISRN